MVLYPRLYAVQRRPVNKIASEETLRSAPPAPRSALEQALTRNDSAESEALHRQWIERLLSEYYDPMYEYQMNKKLDRVIYRGSREEFLAWASHLNRQG